MRNQRFRVTFFHSAQLPLMPFSSSFFRPFNSRRRRRGSGGFFLLLLPSSHSLTVYCLPLPLLALPCLSSTVLYTAANLTFLFFPATWFHQCICRDTNCISTSITLNCLKCTLYTNWTTYIVRVNSRH